jgi:hypothetical protein
MIVSGRGLQVIAWGLFLFAVTPRFADPSQWIVVNPTRYSRAKAPDRLISRDVFHGVWFLGQHLHNHRRLDGPGAHRVDADTPRGIFKRSTRAWMRGT